MTETETPDARKPGQRFPGGMDGPTAVRQWLRGHYGQAFSTKEVQADLPHLSSTAISGYLVRYSEDGSFPDLARTGKSTWTLQRGAKPAEPNWRVTREAPLRTGAKLEIVGHDHAGIMLARDPAGRLWVVKPLELTA